RVGVVRVLPLPLRQKRRAIHHGVAASTGLLSMLVPLLFEHAGAVAAGGAAAALIFLPRPDASPGRRRPAALFWRCVDLFSSYRVTQEGAHSPQLKGQYKGIAVRLEAIVDDMAWRKIPSLWLKVTVLAPNPCAGALDFLVRPRGAEVYSPSNDLP